MKLNIITFIIAMSVSIGISAQTITGKVIDTEGQSVEFANVALYSLPDSILITGTVTNQQGEFTITTNNDSDIPTLLQISFIGYEVQTVLAESGRTIILQNDSKLLDDVIIESSRPTYKMEADGLSTRIENTVLSKLGTANDVLAYLPFVDGEDGKFTVFGRGTPIIYLNNRLLRDNDELKQLSSSDIKDVKVVLNPGSRYDASVGAVIRITTIAPVGEGFSATLHTELNQRRLFNNYEYVNLNYRKDKIDIFARVTHDKYTFDQNQREKQIIDLDKKYITDNDKRLTLKSHTLFSMVGLNYSFQPTHMIGVRYSYTNVPKNEFYMKGSINHFIDDFNDNNYSSNNFLGNKSRRNYLNMYYHNELKNETVIHFEGDYVTGGSDANQSSDFKNIADNKLDIVNSNSDTDYSLYAGNIVVERSMDIGKITFGGEGSYTDNKQSYEMLNSDIAEDLPSNINKSQQLMVAAHLSYDYSWNNLSLNAGLRYEHIDFKYYLNSELSKEQSRKYNNWFPTLSIAYRSNDFSSSLGYKTTVRRPNYFNLRSSISYNDPYTYEGGNPSLKSMFTSKLSYLLGWKDLQIEMSYNWIKDNLLFVAEQFKDKPILLFTMINLPYSESFNAYVNYSPKVSFWRPTFSVGLFKQYLKINDQTYNRPYYSSTWNNIFQLPKDYQIAFNMRANFKGNSGVIMDKPNFKSDMMLSKDLFDSKLSLQLSATDIFGTSLERWNMDMGSIYSDKWNDSDHRGISLQATYRFNSSRSKYKGSGATDEINRL